MSFTEFSMFQSLFHFEENSLLYSFVQACLLTLVERLIKTPTREREACKILSVFSLNDIASARIFLAVERRRRIERELRRERLWRIILPILLRNRNLLLSAQEIKHKVCNKDYKDSSARMRFQNALSPFYLDASHTQTGDTG